MRPIPIDFEGGIKAATRKMPLFAHNIIMIGKIDDLPSTQRPRTDKIFMPSLNLARHRSSGVAASRPRVLPKYVYGKSEYHVSVGCKSARVQVQNKHVSTVQSARFYQAKIGRIQKYAASSVNDRCAIIVVALMILFRLRRG